MDPTEALSAQPPDTTPAAHAAAWLADPTAPAKETAAERLISQWESEPEWTDDQL